MSLEEVVEMSGACWENIKRNIIEKDNERDFRRAKEAIGDLIGRKVGNKYIIINSYPWVSAKTTSKGTYFGEESARRRIWRIYEN